MRVLLITSSFENETQEPDVQCNSHYSLGKETSRICITK